MKSNLNGFLVFTFDFKQKYPNFIKLKGTSGDCETEPIYIHFDIDNYESHYMGKPTKNFKYIYERMVPPGHLVFFFTGNKLQTHSLTYPFYDEINSTIKVLSSHKNLEFS